MEKPHNKNDRTKKESLSYFFRGMATYWELLAEEKKIIGATFAMVAVLQALTLIFYLIMKTLFDEIPRLVETGAFSRHLLVLVLALFITKIVITSLNRFVVEKNFLKSIIRLENRWPAKAQKKLLELPLGYHERENTGKKIAKVEKGCERLVDITGRLRWGFLPQLFYILFNLVIVFFIDWRLGALFFAPFLPAVWLYFRAFRKAVPVYDEWERKKEEAAGLFCQSIVNIQTVQAYVQERRERESFSALREEMRRLDEEISLKIQKYNYAAITTLYSFFIVVIAFGIWLVIRGESTPGTIVYILATGSVNMEGLWSLVHEYTQILRRIVSVVRMKSLLDEKSTIVNAPNAFSPDVFTGHFEFRQVRFTYPGKVEPVLKNINLSIRPGEMIAFVGKSGEGKTTITKLLCRMFDIDQGQIMLDGRDIRGLDLGWLRRKFAVVQQEVDIFDASILDNVRYAEPFAPLEDAREAIKAAFLEKALADRRRFPGGIHELVGEKGVRLSGGERQRVGIARAYLALLLGARVLILDEATSNLDSQAERAIQKMLRDLKQRRDFTVIAIAHRLSTIRRADRIYVIDEGRIAEQGSHDNLLARNGLYAKLVELQNMGELRE